METNIIIIIVVVILCCCCSSSIGLFFMMSSGDTKTSGEEDEKTTRPAVTTPVTTTPAVTTPVTTTPAVTTPVTTTPAVTTPVTTTPAVTTLVTTTPIIQILPYSNANNVLHYQGDGNRINNILELMIGSEDDCKNKCTSRTDCTHFDRYSNSCTLYKGGIWLGSAGPANAVFCKGPGPCGNGYTYKP